MTYIDNHMTYIVDSENIYIWWLLKDCLPYLFHSFRNKCFNKILLGNILYVQNKLYRFGENAWLSDKYAMKTYLQNNM